MNKKPIQKLWAVVMKVGQNDDHVINSKWCIFLGVYMSVMMIEENSMEILLEWISIEKSNLYGLDAE